MTSKKRRIFLLILVGVMLIIIIYIDRTYKEYKNYDYVISYLNEKYNNTFKIKKIDFKHYDYGITGGLFMYSFLVKDENGETYNVNYQEYFPLNEKNVQYITFEKQ
ncbi:MAG: hypothetical protein NC086_01450 [Alistipes sp.]|nr:hypothetical protein [Alistipes sp.]